MTPKNTVARLIFIKEGFPKLKKYYLYLGSTEALAEFLIKKYSTPDIPVYIAGRTVRDFFHQEEPELNLEKLGHKNFTCSKKKFNHFALYRVDDLLAWDAENDEETT